MIISPQGDGGARERECNCSQAGKQRVWFFVWSHWVHVNIGSVCVGRHMIACIWRSEHKLRWRFLPSTLFKRGPLFARSVAQVSWSRSLQRLSTLPFAVRTAGLQTHGTVPRFTWVLGVHTQGLTLAWHAYHLPRHLPSPSEHLPANDVYSGHLNQK